MARSAPWTEDELLVVFRLYCRTPFGRLDQRNPDIVELSRLLRRTPSAVTMKACNFASLDPSQRARKIRGLGNASHADRELWQRFDSNPEQVAFEAETAYSMLIGRELAPVEEEIRIPEGSSEVLRNVRVRKVQAFFRDAVLVSYSYRCALSELAVPELLNASHIIPWSIDIERRADPRNGIALNALYDRAFDRGLMTFDPSLRVVLSRRLKTQSVPLFHRETLLKLEGRKLRLPVRFVPDADAMAYHRSEIFCDC